MKLPTAKQIDATLAVLEKRRAILENAVSGVVNGFAPALFVWGSPGLGKSHLLTTILDGIAGKNWTHHTAYSTPKALMLALVERPEGTHLFEDCERMMKTDLSASILRAACGAPSDRDRWVTWETSAEKLRVNFKGGIIIATNANLARQSGPMQGVASRFRPIKWDMTLTERMHLILHIAEGDHCKGGIPISAKEARKVAVRLIEMVSEERAEFDLDIRLFTEHALPAFAQAKANPGQSWEDMMLAKLSGTAMTQAESQEGRTRRLRQLAESIHLGGGTIKERIQKWVNATNLGKSIYYRHLKSAKAAK